MKNLNFTTHPASEGRKPVALPGIDPDLKTTYARIEKALYPVVEELTLIYDQLGELVKEHWHDLAPQNDQDHEANLLDELFELGKLEIDVWLTALRVFDSARELAKHADEWPRGAE